MVEMKEQGYIDRNGTEIPVKGETSMSTVNMKLISRLTALLIFFLIAGAFRLARALR